MDVSLVQVLADVDTCGVDKLIIANESHSEGGGGGSVSNQPTLKRRRKMTMMTMLDDGTCDSFSLFIIDSIRYTGIGSIGNDDDDHAESHFIGFKFWGLRIFNSHWKFDIGVMTWKNLES